MTAALGPTGYDRITDPAALRIAVRELSMVQEWLTQFADGAAEMVDVPAERVVGIRLARAVVSRLHQLALARLTVLMSTTGRDAVVVLEPGREPLADSLLRWSVLPVITALEVATHGISSAVTTLRPGHASVPHLNHEDVIIVAIFGSVLIIWWDEHGIKRQLPQLRHQHAFIRRGTRHCVYNAGVVPAVAVQVRAAADVRAGVAPAPADVPDRAVSAAGRAG